MTKNVNNEHYKAIWLIRRLFRALAQRSNESLADKGITAAERAVMEFLFPDKKLSVPEIAKRYQVSRQHVQVTVNILLESRLVIAQENPRHKRSPLILLNQRGRELFQVIRNKDEEIVERLFADITSSDIHVTRKTLESLLNTLNEETGEHFESEDH